MTLDAIFPPGMSATFTNRAAISGRLISAATSLTFTSRSSIALRSRFIGHLMVSLSSAMEDTFLLLAKRKPRGFHRLACVTALIEDERVRDRDHPEQN